MASARAATILLFLCLGTGLGLKATSYLEAASNVLGAVETAEVAYGVAGCAALLPREAFSDICLFADAVVAHWDDANGGCGNVVEEQLPPDYLACATIMSCREGSADEDPWLGICWAACENSYEDDNVSTQCKKSIFTHVGLTRADICDDVLPTPVDFQYMSPVEVLLSALVTVAFAILSIWSTFWTIQHSDEEIWPGMVKEEDMDVQISYGSRHTTIGESFGAVYHGLVIIHMFAFMIRSLADANRACRFIIMNTPSMYGPYFFSWTQSAALLGPVWPRLRHYPIDNISISDKCKMFILVAGSIPWLMATLMQFLAGIAMFIVSSWGLVAYAHITLIMAVGGALIGLLATVPVFPIMNTTPMRKNGTFRAVMMLGYRFGPIVLSVSACLLMYMCVCSFMLFYTGDYLAFHRAFFDELRDMSLPSLPDFNLPPWNPQFSEVLIGIFSLDFDLTPELLFEASVWMQLALTFAIVAERVVTACRRRRRNSANAAACRRRNRV